VEDTSAEAQATASMPSAIVSRIGSAVAEISTGARKRNENGFCRPPVRNKKSGQFDDVQGQQSGA